MSHSPSRHRIDKLEAAQVAAEKAERDGLAAKAAASAKRVVAAWNARIAGGKAAEFFPTIGTAVVAGYYVLKHRCPACKQAGSLDLRTVADAHHPRAPISVLIPALSCEHCCPNPPLATLLELEKPAPYTSPTLADFPFDPVRIACARCDRRGQYSKTKLIQRLGADIVGPDLLRHHQGSGGHHRLHARDARHNGQSAATARYFP